MESTLVSARIPHAKKDVGVALLESMGATTSELINSAFDYLIEAKSLPRCEADPVRDRQAFAEFLAAGTLDIDWGPQPELVDYGKILREGKRADYESLA